MIQNEKIQTHRELVDLLNCAIEPEQRVVAYDKSKQFLAENLNDSNAHFLFGYACYGLSYTRKQVLSEAIQAFQRCLELGPSEWDRQMTVYHLGFIYFRQHRYQDTLALIGQRNPDFFKSIDQFWRVAKLDEVELASQYYLQPDKLSLNHAEELEKQYAHFDEVCDAPLLIEIGDCLSDLLKNSTQTNPVLSQVCDVIIRTIRHLGQSDTLKKREGLFFQRLS